MAFSYDLYNFFSNIMIFYVYIKYIYSKSDLLCFFSSSWIDIDVSFIIALF